MLKYKVKFDDGDSINGWADATPEKLLAIFPLGSSVERSKDTCHHNTKVAAIEISDADVVREEHAKADSTACLLVLNGDEDIDSLLDILDIARNAYAARERLFLNANSNDDFCCRLELQAVIAEIDGFMERLRDLYA